MASHNGFFSHVKTDWNNYAPLLTAYDKIVPIPQRSYFNPISSIDEFSTALLNPINSPVWLGLNTVMFAVKCALSIAASLLLVIPTVALAIIAPNSALSASCSSAFKQAAASSVVSFTMSAISCLATFASLFCNPLNLLTRCVSTGVSKLNDVTQNACGLTIASCN